MEKGSKNLREVAIEYPVFRKYLDSSKEVYNLIGIDIENGEYFGDSLIMEWNPTEKRKFQAYEDRAFGGLALSLVDSAGILAVIEAAKEGKSAYTSSVDKARFVRPISVGKDSPKVIIEGKNLVRNGSLLTLESELNQNGDLVMVAKLNFKIK